MCRESIVLSYGIDFTFSTIRSIEKVLHWSKKLISKFWRNTRFEACWFQKTNFGMSSVCLSVCLSVLSVCLSVCEHHNSTNNCVSSTKFGMRSYMIKISVGIAYEQNRATGVASALRAQFCFWVKSALKMHCTNIFFQTKLVTNHNTQLLVPKCFWSPNGYGLCPDSTIRVSGEKCLKNALYKIFLPDKSCYKSIFATFMLCNSFRYLAPLWSYSGFSDM